MAAGLPWDTYVIRARLRPALLVFLPLALTVAITKPGGSVGLGALWGLIIAGGGTAALAQVARDRGRSREPALFGRWGGAPTVIGLRHRDAVNDAILQRRHARLSTIFPDLFLPDRTTEGADPARADEHYESAVYRLREATRDRKRFRLVYEENCNYGFRRNLWGLKPLGVTLSIIGVVGAYAILTGRLGTVVDPTIGMVVLGINLLIALFWMVWVGPNWVRTAADAYAERLLGTLETLP